jgi:hypothetical protein
MQDTPEQIEVKPRQTLRELDAVLGGCADLMDSMRLFLARLAAGVRPSAIEISELRKTGATCRQQTAALRTQFQHLMNLLGE